MREACLNAVRKCNVIGSRGSADGWFGGVLAALEQVEADIRALPAPEVPDRTRFLHALDEWHEGYGDVLWWRFPIVEPPHLGSPLETDWKDGYYTHWTEFAVPEKSSWPK